jgi:hypothetical protein
VKIVAPAIQKSSRKIGFHFADQSNGTRCFTFNEQLTQLKLSSHCEDVRAKNKKRDLVLSKPRHEIQSRLIAIAATATAAAAAAAVFTTRATAAAATAAGGTIFARTRDIDGERATAKLGAVQCLNGLLGFFG